jgi:TatD DNase family protein
MNLIDTHCHLNDLSFYDRMSEVIERAKIAGVDAFIVPAYDMESLERTAQLAGLYPGRVFPAYGLHPWFVGEHADFTVIHSFIMRADAIAVGEIGLDFSAGCPPAEIQLPAFIRQLDIAAELKLPVLIHCRKAYDQLYEILKRYRGILTGVIHSYSGGKDFIERFIGLDYYVAFSGSVTRQSARKYHRAAEAVPMDRILLETDAPSIATESTVASRVEPCDILEVAAKIAELRDISADEVCRCSTENTLRLFDRIPRS